MPGRVLVADDEPLTAEMIAVILAFHGYEVTCSYDGEDALARAREMKPDAVLLDVLMPGLDGDVVTRLLRTCPAMEECPVVLISSADEADVPWREAGADAFLQKPFDLRHLPGLVAGLLEARPRKKSAAMPRRRRRSHAA